jgi:tetratricopeptide (TPR) repeat protein
MHAPDDRTGIQAVSRTALILAPVIWAAHFLPFALPDGRVWGFNHLLFLSPGYTVLFTVLGALALAAIALSPVRQVADRLFGSVADTVAGRPLYARWAVMAIGSLAVFWLARLPLSLLGDGYSVVHNISAKIPVVVKWSEMGAVKIVQSVSNILPYAGLEKGMQAYAAVSVVSGALTVFVFLALAFELGRDSRGRLFAFCLLLFSGWTLLFFGYTENYPVLWPAVTGYLYFSIRYLREKTNLVLPVLFLLAAVVLHLQTVFLLPSIVPLLIARGAGKTLANRFRKPLWMAGILIVIGGVTVFYMACRRSLAFRAFFLPLLSGRPLTPDYFLFSPSHILDIINEITLLIPLWPLAFVAGRRQWREVLGDIVARFLLVVSLGGALLLFALEPKLGMARDWDLFALAGLGPMMLLITALVSSERWRPLYPGLALLALGLSFPFWAVNMSRPTTISYFESLLRLDDRQSRPGMIVLRDYYYDIGDSTRAVALDREIYQKFPAIRMARKASELSANGDFENAMIMADSVYGINPYSPEGYSLRGLVLMRNGYYETGLKEFEKSLSLAEYDWRTYVNVALAYNHLHKIPEMMKALRRAQKLNPEDPVVLEALAMGFVVTREYDSARIYGHHLLERDSTAYTGYLAIGAGYYGVGDLVQAQRYLLRYVELAPECPDRRNAIAILNQIAKAGLLPPKQ